MNLLRVISLTNGMTLGNKPNVSSAIYNQAGDCVIATSDTRNEHFLILEPNSLLVSKALKIDFSDYCTHDFYRIFYLCDYIENHLIVYGGVFLD
jgi:hypothetical protein